MAGIKETKELIEGLGALADAAVEVMADGKVTLGDASVLPGLFMALKPAVEGVDQVKGELSELSKEELLEIVGAVVDVAKKIKDKLG